MSRAKKINVIVFAVLAVILLYLSMGAMIGLPLPQFLSMHSAPRVYAIVLLCFTSPFLVYGTDIFAVGIKSLFKGAPNMDTLVTLGVAS